MHVVIIDYTNKGSAFIISLPDIVDVWNNILIEELILKKTGIDINVNNNIVWSVVENLTLSM